MSSLSRRDLMRAAALSALAGPMDADAAQHVHQMAAEETEASGGTYRPKCFTEHEFRTLQRLAALVIPPDDKSPGAAQAGAPEFIDYLAGHNAELASIFTGGIGWLDHHMIEHHSAAFLDASPEQQAAVLDRIAYRNEESGGLAPGIQFFDWARKMIFDGYYTSPSGIKALGYMGNVAKSEFQAPRDVIVYAIDHSPFRGESA